ncbi:unnamed protein product [Durusdinium trenchii]|uniref:Cyclic nucleotide-binding domain-containing protein n=1 Tax=Durusdinium trenchii TaxID=1381693 RepID=A0ABP0MYY3_9DINO
MVLKVFAALLVMLSVNHMIACAWYAVGTNFRIDVESNWLKRMELEEVGMFEAYVASLHWSLTQFTPSTNNVAPTNSLERLFAIFVILLAMGCFSSFVGSITATVNALRSIQATKTKQHSEVLRFFAERKMSLDLFQKVKYVIRTEKLMDDPLMENEVTMLKFLPKRFRIQLHEEMYMHDLLQLPFWPSGVKTREHVFLAEVCHSAMQEEIARKYEDIFLPGTECHAAYLMQPGLIPIQEVCVYIGTLTEALDPAMDSWTAANAAMMYTSSAREKFTAVWAPVPVVGHVVGQFARLVIFAEFVHHQSFSIS